MSKKQPRSLSQMFSKKGGRPNFGDGNGQDMSSLFEIANQEVKDMSSFIGEIQGTKNETTENEAENENQTDNDNKVIVPSRK